MSMLEVGWQRLDIQGRGRRPSVCLGSKHEVVHTTDQVKDLGLDLLQFLLTNPDIHSNQWEECLIQQDEDTYAVYTRLKGGGEYLIELNADAQLRVRTNYKYVSDKGGVHKICFLYSDGEGSRIILNRYDSESGNYESDVILLESSDEYLVAHNFLRNRLLNLMDVVTESDRWRDF